MLPQNSNVIFYVMASDHGNIFSNSLIILLDLALTVCSIFSGDYYFVLLLLHKRSFCSRFKVSFLPISILMLSTHSVSQKIVLGDVPVITKSDYISVEHTDG